jgi:UDP-glucose 4-epimerase
VSKLAEEHLAIAYHTERGLPVTVVRPFNVYGPGQVGEGALRTFIERSVQNLPIEIHGDGTQIRAWCYVDDMVRGVLLSLTHPAAVGESFNIGNQRAVTTIYGLANTVVRITGSSSTVSFVDKEYVDVELRVPSVVKARDLIGFEAEVDLDEGIATTAAHVRKQLGL